MHAKPEPSCKHFSDELEPPRRSALLLSEPHTWSRASGAFTFELPLSLVVHCFRIFDTQKILFLVLFSLDLGKNALAGHWVLLERVPTPGSH